jgi:ubiquinol-cytochrome c reductase cytochrome c subunit
MQPRRHEGHEATRRRDFFFFVYLRALRVFVVAFVLSGVAQAFRAADDAVERGRQTFMRVGCYQCHGREAQGASTGPRLGPNPLPLPAFARAIRTPRNEMPPYSPKLLSDADLADAHAFVAARARPHQLPR